MAASRHAAQVDEDYPCDTVATEERELCLVPEALIQAPTALDSCAGTKLALDGTRSAGGGIKPLVFEWAAHPTKTPST